MFGGCWNPPPYGQLRLTLGETLSRIRRHIDVTLSFMMLILIDIQKGSRPMVPNFFDHWTIIIENPIEVATTPCTVC